jgi:hypothetical protein
VASARIMLPSRPASVALAQATILQVLVSLSPSPLRPLEPSGLHVYHEDIRVPIVRLLTDHQASVHQPTMPSAPAILIPLLDYSAAVRLQGALEQTQAVHSVRLTTPLDRHQPLVLRPLRAAEEASLGHRPQRRPAVQASVDSVPPTRRAPRHHLAEAVHPCSAVPISQPPLSGPPQHLPQALPSSVVETPAVLLGLQVLLALGQPTTRA